jgi:hypothetical protein
MCRSRKNGIDASARMISRMAAPHGRGEISPITLIGPTFGEQTAQAGENALMTTTVGSKGGHYLWYAHARRL